MSLTVSLLAIRLIGKEFAEVETLVRSATELSALGLEILFRYRIACKHTVIRHYLNNEPLPLTLFHPRWLINGPPIRSTGWEPLSAQMETIQQPLSMSSTLNQVAQVYADLEPTARTRFDIEMKLLRQATDERALQRGRELLSN
jgi:hypothetical protein